MFPDNREYITGECYMNWSRDSAMTSGFIVECAEISDILIREASPSRNSLLLVDGTTVASIAFILRPTFKDGELKEYGIGSNTTDGKIQINIITYDSQEAVDKNQE